MLHVPYIHVTCHLSLVTVTSGQSNMEFSMANILDREASIANAHIDGLRLFAVQKNTTASTSPDTPDDLLDLQYPGWVQVISVYANCRAQSSPHMWFCRVHPKLYVVLSMTATTPSSACPTVGQLLLSRATTEIHGAISPPCVLFMAESW